MDGTAVTEKPYRTARQKPSTIRRGRRCDAVFIALRLHTAICRMYSARGASRSRRQCGYCGRAGRRAVRAPGSRKGRTVLRVDG